MKQANNTTPDDNLDINDPDFDPTRTEKNYQTQDRELFTKGQKLAWTFRPFLSPGLEKLSDVDPTIEDMARAIDNAFKPEYDLLKELADLSIRAEHSPHQVNALVQKAELLTRITNKK